MTEGIFHEGIFYKRDFHLPPKEETVYYYRKPGSEYGDPSTVISGTNIHLFGGEIFIGKDETVYPEEKIIEDLERFFSEETKNVFAAQKEYFGEEVFGHIEVALISLLRKTIKKLEEKNASVPSEIMKKIYNEEWPF